MSARVSGSALQPLDDLGRGEAVAAPIEGPIEERRHLARHEDRVGGSLDLGERDVRTRGRVAGDDGQRHVDLGDRCRSRNRASATASPWGWPTGPALDGDGLGWSLRQALRRIATPTMASGLQRRDGIGADGSRT